MDHYKSEFRMTETRRGGKKAASGNPDISEVRSI